MKTKNFNKKLVFNKKTIVNLNNAEVNGIKGGISFTYCIRTCPTPNSAVCQVSFFGDCPGSEVPDYTCAPTCY